MPSLARLIILDFKVNGDMFRGEQFYILAMRGRTFYILSNRQHICERSEGKTFEILSKVLAVEKG